MPRRRPELPPPPAPERAIVASVGDLHITSTVGLCPPVANLDDGGTYHASPAQRQLWDCWTDFWQGIAARTPAGAQKIAIINGDAVEADVRGRSYQMITRHKATMLSIALAVLEPLLAWAEQVYVIRGTEAHVGKGGQYEEMLAADLTTAVGPGPGQPRSWWHLRRKIAGVRFDVAHHVQMSGIPWNEKFAAIRLAERIQYQYLVQMRQPAPQVVLRSHVHRRNDSGRNDSGRNYADMIAIIQPAWQLRTAYNYRIASENSLAHIGGVWLDLQGGQVAAWDYQTYPFTEQDLWA